MNSKPVCHICGSSQYDVIFKENVAHIHQIVKCVNYGLTYAFLLVQSTLSLGRLFWNLGVMSKSTAVQKKVQHLIDKFDLLHSAHIHLNIGDMVRMYGRKVSG